MFILIRVEACFLDRFNDSGLIAVSSVGTSFDELEASPLLTGESLLQGIFLDVGCPADQLIHFAEDNLDLGVREQWRELEIMLREFQVSFGSGSALVLGLAEAAPFTTQEIPISGEGQFCGGLQYFVCPAVERVFADLERADVLPSRLVDGHGNLIDVVDAIEKLQSAERVTLHLRVFIC